MSAEWEKLQDEIRHRSPHPERVTILGACKAQPVDKVRARIADGLNVLGNNYVQEGHALREQLSDFKGEWHFIGHIQSRKARELVDYDCVQSLDRISVAQELNRRLEEKNRRIKVLVEVNVGGEDSKSGIPPENLEEFLFQLRLLHHLDVDGLMGMPPPLQPVENRRPHFKKLRALFDEFGKGAWRRLSMGTSEDYAVALEEGSTLIRLGTVLFGERPARP